MYQSCEANGADTKTPLKVEYVETPGTPAIPARAATDGNPAIAAVPAKDPVYATVPFRDLLLRKWDWVKWEKHESAEFYMKSSLET